MCTEVKVARSAKGKETSCHVIFDTFAGKEKTIEIHLSSEQTSLLFSLSNF